MQILYLIKPTELIQTIQPQPTWLIYKNKINIYNSTVELIKGFYNHYIVYKRHYKNIMEYYNEFIWQGNYIVNYINSFTNRDVKDILIYYYHKFLY